MLLSSLGSSDRPKLRRSRLVLALLLLVPPALCACRTAAVADAATPLTEVGERLDRRLAAGERQSFTLDLEAGLFVHLVVAERGADVAATLTGPSGEVLAAADGPGEGRAQELLAAVTREAGRHRVEVGLRAGAGAGAYQLRYLTLRPAEPTDGRLIEGMRAYLEGRVLDRWDALPEQRARALAAYDEAAGHFAAIGDDNYLAWTLVRAAGLHDDAPGRSEELSRRAEAIFVRLGEASGGLATALTELARSLVRQGRFEEAREVFDRVFAVATDLPGRARNLNNRAELLIQVDELARAEADLRQALELWRQAEAEGLDVAPDLITTLINLGVAQRRSGELLEAFRSYEAAGALAETHGNRRIRVHLASNLGSYYIVTGELQRALETLTAGLAAAQELGDASAERAIAGKLGQVYQQLGQPDEARRHFESALELARRLGEPAKIGDSLRLLGLLDSQTGDPDRAREQLDEALELVHDSPTGRAAVLRDLAGLELATGHPERGLEVVRRAKRLSSAASPSMVASVLRLEAAALARLGRTEEAREVLTSALDPALRLDDPLLLGSMHALLGGLERARGDLDSALDHLETALALHELIRSRVADPYQRATFSADRYAHFQAMIDLLMELESRRPSRGYARRAFQTSERQRARSLVELLAEARVDVQRKVRPELRRREEELSLRVALLQNELLLVGTEEGEAAPMAGAARLRAALETTRSEQRRLAAEIRSTSSSYASLRYPEPLDLAQLQGLLPRRDALLHFSLGAERSFLFVVRRDGFDAFPIAPAQQIRDAVAALGSDLAADDPRSQRRISRGARALFDQLLGPADRLLTTAERLWVVPDGVLFRLPFEVLRNDRGPLIDQATISYLPSANVIELLPGTGPRQHDSTFVAFAGVTGGPVEAPSLARNQLLRPLPGTVEEVEAIARLLPDRSRLYLGAEAHQGNLFDNPEVTHALWLHFASHAWILDDSAESAILLSPDADGDRFLQFSEVFNLELNAEVVVLSACETALGETLRGEGMMGLARAFFYAGAPNLVVSLWPVDDRATARLMEAFYSQLAAGLAPSDALRQAKLGLIRTTPYRSPRFWAPFVLLGAPGGRDVTTAGAQAPLASSAVRTIELKEGKR